jgi:predicted regulator of Ras-like GTPase activity (Roadblock/LC7/MglB family)
MFKSLFAGLEQSLPGMKAIALVGDDGIEVDSYVKDDLPHEVLSAEMNGILRNLDRLRHELELGKLTEVILRTQNQNIILFSLAEGLFILLVTEPTETTGRARFEIQRLAPKFVEILK